MTSHRRSEEPLDGTVTSSLHRRHRTIEFGTHDHRSVHALEKDIRDWVKHWNDNPRPFIWTKSAEQILASLGRLLQRINGAGH